MTTFYLGQSERTIKQLRKEANIHVTPMGNIVRNEVVVTARKYTFFKDTQPRLSDKQCKREGWDTEEGKFELCGSRFKYAGCKCHPNYCPDCSAETHGHSLTLPGVLEGSSLMHHCSSKGKHG